MNRFKDKNISIQHFEDEVFVECPKCKKETIAVKCLNCGNTENYSPRNVTKEWKYESTGKPSENYFGLPLWLTANFRGNKFGHIIRTT